MKKEKKNNIFHIAVIGIVIVAVILSVGTYALGKAAGRDTEDAVRNVSLLYLSELAGRREQVVSATLDDYKKDMDIAIGLIDKDDLADTESLQNYQLQMKQLYDLEKFAFIDTNGLIYTSRGTRNDIDEYQLDYNNLTEPSVFIKHPESKNKKVVIAMPVDNLPFDGQTLVVCFMEISMEHLLEDVSLQSNNNMTFCNIYTAQGNALTNMVLGGLASEDNLLEAMEYAQFDDGYSLDGMKEDFSTGRDGVVSFTYYGIKETLYYVSVHDTDWMLTYLIRESTIGEQINSISDSIITRGLIQSILTALVLAGMFAIMIIQMRSTAKATIEKEVSEAENRVKQQELEEQQALQLELEEALKGAEEANRAKSDFVSNMSHEIRTPITAILGMNEMIRRECDDTTILSYAENIRNAGISLLGIISDILDFSKIEAGRMELTKGDYRLSDLVGDLYNLIRFSAEAGGLKLRFLIDPTLPSGLFGDEIRVKQIIVNLLTNAVKYTEKGNVILEMTCAETKNDRVRISVSVTDTGIGIKPEEMNKLFSAFDRLDTSRNRGIEGTGLGLSITRQLLSMMHAELKVESRYNEGSRFYFDLWQDISDPKEIGAFDPADSIGISDATDKNSHPFTAPGKRILIVDDTPMNLQVVAGLLKRTKMTIETASCGEECIECFGKNNYDIVFLDYRMPGLDGIETIKKLALIYPEKFAATPFICLTASAVTGDRERLIEAGFTDYLSKPVNIAEMEEMLRSNLHMDPVIMTPDDGIPQADDEISKLPAQLLALKSIDIKKGIEYCGDADDYIDALKIFYSSMDEKAEELEKALKEEDMETFTLTAHSLKSTSRAIGAYDISDRAASLEEAGNRNDLGSLKSDTPLFIKAFRQLHDELAGLEEVYQYSSSS